MNIATTREPSGGIVAIIDDDARNRDRLADYVRSRNFEPLVFPLKLASVEMLVRSVKEKGAAYAICDHRLFEADYASFFGAAAVAGLYDSHQVAPLLVTGYENDDSETSIRIYRRKIPVLLHSTEVTPDSLMAGLLCSRQEVVEGVISPDREPCPAILTVTQILPHKNEGSIVKVIIAQWDSQTEVGFPISMMPIQIRNALRPGSFLYADVNVDAQRAEDLYFFNFVLPEPNDVHVAATNFNYP